jgi:hypothetical protein
MLRLLRHISFGADFYTDSNSVFMFKIKVVLKTETEFSAQNLRDNLVFQLKIPHTCLRNITLFICFSKSICVKGDFSFIKNIFFTNFKISLQEPFASWIELSFRFSFCWREKSYFKFYTFGGPFLVRFRENPLKTQRLSPKHLKLFEIANFGMLYPSIVANRKYK